MKLSIAAFALLLASCVGTHAREPQVEWVDFGPDPFTNQEFLDAMTRAGTPGPEQEELAKGVGHYHVDMKMWMEPGAEPIPMTGIADVEMIFGGRYMVQHFHGTDPMGQPFEGMLLMGYDNLAGQYWSFWIDSGSTGYALSTGTGDASGNTSLTGMMRDPRTPHGRPFRSVTIPGEDGSFVFQMYDTLPDGGEYESLEMTYRK